MHILGMLQHYNAGYKDSISAYMGKTVSVDLFSQSEMLSYKSMVLSGDIKLIKILKVKEKFTELESKYAAIKLHEDFIQNDYTKLLNENFDLLSQSKLIKPDLYTDVKFKNKIVFYYALNKQRERYTLRPLKPQARPKNC